VQFFVIFTFIGGKQGRHAMAFRLVECRFRLFDLYIQSRRITFAALKINNK